MSQASADCSCSLSEALAHNQDLVLFYPLDRDFGRFHFHPQGDIWERGVPPRYPEPPENQI